MGAEGDSVQNRHANTTPAPLLLGAAFPYSVRNPATGLLPREDPTEELKDMLSFYWELSPSSRPHPSTVSETIFFVG